MVGNKGFLGETNYIWLLKYIENKTGLYQAKAWKVSIVSMFLNFVLICFQKQGVSVGYETRFKCAKATKISDG